jgi:hypothetical protein
MRAAQAPPTADDYVRLRRSAGGVPFIFWNTGIQILQQQHQITILYSNDHKVRHVRMNQPHPARVTPSWYGDSVGHYEGDTLAIDTVGIKVGPFATVDQYGTPHIEALHVVERYRLQLTGDEQTQGPVRVQAVRKPDLIWS